LKYHVRSLPTSCLRLAVSNLMPNRATGFTRRTLLKASIGFPITAVSSAHPSPAAPIVLFDGKTLNGWLQIENSATTFSSGEITDPAAFASKLSTGTDPVSTFLRGRLRETVKVDLATYSAASPNAKTILSGLVRDLNQIVSGRSICDAARFQGVVLRPETAALAAENPHGQTLARMNKLLIEDAYPGELAPTSSTGWIVRDGAMASTGSGRGVIYTAHDYSRFRLSFTMRHVSGNPDHQACVLIFCTRPEGGDKPLDALGGVQFQVPNGGHWDYRPGMNNNGGAEFTTVTKTSFNVHDWSRVEIIADATAGTARMSVAQPVEGRLIEVLRFMNPTAGKTGPIGWQMHNAGLFDEYKDVSIEIDGPGQ